MAVDRTSTSVLAVFKLGDCMDPVLEAYPGYCRGSTEAHIFNLIRCVPRLHRVGDDLLGTQMPRRLWPCSPKNDKTLCTGCETRPVVSGFGNVAVVYREIGAVKSEGAATNAFHVYDSVPVLGLQGHFPGVRFSWSLKMDSWLRPEQVVLWAKSLNAGSLIHDKP